MSYKLPLPLSQLVTAGITDPKIRRPATVLKPLIWRSPVPVTVPEVPDSKKSKYQPAREAVLAGVAGRPQVKLGTVIDVAVTTPACSWLLPEIAALGDGLESGVVLLLSNTAYVD